MMRYKINAYLTTNSPVLISTLETDDFYELQDFVLANLDRGYNCQVIDNETNDVGWAYAESNENALLEDLRLELSEQA